ncbi:hypothetical protein FQN57_003554 [Myotisia sp. PD_48]|nr:hypothetical protein FQN57_003554 [Myotisia sp. PD_48]
MTIDEKMSHSEVEQTLPSSYHTLFTTESRLPYDYLHLGVPESEYAAILQQPLAADVFGHDSDAHSYIVESDRYSFIRFIARNVGRILRTSPSEELNINRSRLLHIGHAALSAFLQANVTGPPLPFQSDEVVFPKSLRKSENPESTRKLRDAIIRDLSVDGEAVYKLTPNVELFAVAKAILNHETLLGGGGSAGDASKPPPPPMFAVAGRLRVNVLHQKMLNENTDTLQAEIYRDLDLIYNEISTNDPVEEGEIVRFLLERAVVHTNHGFDSKARTDLLQAAKMNKFEFALTGRLGKRTKFQDRDITQLVVLAKSAEISNPESDTPAKEDEDNDKASDQPAKEQPKNLDLNDDTLLESISFKPKDTTIVDTSMTVQDESSLPPTLASLDPAKQPRLSPIDSIILLSLASAITNTSPTDGLTREETRPYAARVLDGGSSNWQVYSQALLVRSRIEGYRSRTVERGVLQLQTLVDQVLADTATDSSAITKPEEQELQPATFLPRPQASESAPASERLQYLWLLNFSTRWDLEAELASRWVSIGALRTALDIYERLEMWAEAALCYAATDREDKARVMTRKQLYQRTNDDVVVEEDAQDAFDGPEISPLPVDAPRLFCILGDIDSDAKMYERAWEISKGRYGRAQRSLARLYMNQKPPLPEKAEEAYILSLRSNQLNHGAWFALGCIQLELSKWEEAVKSFTRTVQIEESDAEAWSNLAAALINIPPTTETPQATKQLVLDDEEGQPKDSKSETQTIDIHKPKRDALTALHRAAKFNHEDYRIWDNILTVSASIPPPDTPFKDILRSQTRIIELRGAKDGEKCIVVPVLSALVKTLTSENDQGEAFDPSKVRPGSIPGQLVRLIDEMVVPLITHSSELWLLVAEVERWRGRPSKALAAHEKAWRTTVASCTSAAFELGDKGNWMKIVSATETLIRNGYAVYGGMDLEKDENNPAATGRELVAKDWRFKSRSAVRGIMGKGKPYWDETEGWVRLDVLLKEVSGGS